MRVSVIVAAYNVAQLVSRALDSVARQTFSDWEVVVVDDASTDGTSFVVNERAKADPRIRVIRQTWNQGPAVARNRGIAEAKGEWIAVLDADDAWRPDRLERLLAVADETNATFVADNLIMFDQHLERETGKAFKVPGERIPFSPTHMFSLQNPWEYGILKPMIRRSLFEETGIRYDENLRFGEDFLLTAELLFSGARGVLLRDGWYVYTTPVGHQSREKSTGTRSTTSLSSLMWITDVLAQRYRDRIDRGIAAGLARCRQRIQRRLIAREITRLRQAHSVAGLTAYLVGHPRGAVRYLLTSRSWSRVFGSRLASREGAAT
jgi:succinoglycan biosynthesis protein ExoO